MKLDKTMRKVDWRTTVSRAVGILVLLAGVILATHLCIASSQPDKPVVCSFDSQTSCELGSRR